MTTDLVISPYHIDWTGDFPSQVESVLERVRLTRGEVDGLSQLFFDLEKRLQWIWRGCQVLPFGSIVTGLGICSSDVDCFVQIPERYEYDEPRAVIQTRNLLRKAPWIFQQLFAITTAKVPIVKLYHAPTSRHCDISFKSPAGVRNSKLTACLLQMDARALPLSILIKYWSKVHRLTGTNLLSNYALTTLTIFYMQQLNILPPILLLQRITNQKYFVDDWNTAFCENYCHKTDNTQSLYELLGGFFQFYSTFHFDQYVISPFIGDSIPRPLFTDVKDISKDFYLYKKMVGEREVVPLRLDTPMCVQDFFEHNRNCTTAVFSRLAKRLLLHFQLAAKIFAEGNSRNFLREILLKKPNIPIPVPVQVKRVEKRKDNKNKTPKVPANIEQPKDIPARTNLKRPSENLTALFQAGRAKKAKKNKR